MTKSGSQYLKTKILKNQLQKVHLKINTRANLVKASQKTIITLTTQTLLTMMKKTILVSMITTAQNSHLMTPLNIRPNNKFLIMSI